MDVKHKTNKWLYVLSKERGKSVTFIQITIHAPFFLTSVRYTDESYIQGSVPIALSESELDVKRNFVGDEYRALLSIRSIYCPYTVTF